MVTADMTQMTLRRLTTVTRARDADNRWNRHLRHVGRFWRMAEKTARFEWSFRGK